MEFRLTARRVKHQTVACDYCRKRKVKCSGEMPCGFCQKKGVTCVYSDIKRRRPTPSAQVAGTNTSSSSTPVGHGASVAKLRGSAAASGAVSLPSNAVVKVSRAQIDLDNHFNCNIYVDPFFEYVMPFVRVRPIIRERMENPTEMWHQLVMASAVAFSARSMGHTKVATAMARQARMVASELFDDTHFGAGLGFLLLSMYYRGEDANRASRYAAIAVDIARNVTQLGPYIAQRHSALLEKFGMAGTVWRQLLRSKDSEKLLGQLAAYSFCGISPTAAVKSSTSDLQQAQIQNLTSGVDEYAMLVPQQKVVEECDHDMEGDMALEKASNQDNNVVSSTASESFEGVESETQAVIAAQCSPGTWRSICRDETQAAKMDRDRDIDNLAGELTFYTPAPMSFAAQLAIEIALETLGTFGPVNRAISLALLHPLHELPSKLGIPIHLAPDMSAPNASDAEHQARLHRMAEFMPGDLSMQAFMLAGGSNSNRFELLGMPQGFGGALLNQHQMSRLIARVEEIHQLRKSFSAPGSFVDRVAKVVVGSLKAVIYIKSGKAEEALFCAREGCQELAELRGGLVFLRPDFTSAFLSLAELFFDARDLDSLQSVASSLRNMASVHPIIEPGYHAVSKLLRVAVAERDQLGITSKDTDGHKMAQMQPSHVHVKQEPQTSPINSGGSLMAALPALQSVLSSIQQEGHGIAKVEESKHTQSPPIPGGMTATQLGSLFQQLGPQGDALAQIVGNFLQGVGSASGVSQKPQSDMDASSAPNAEHSSRTGVSNIGIDAQTSSATRLQNAMTDAIGHSVMARALGPESMQMDLDHVGRMAEQSGLGTAAQVTAQVADFATNMCGIGASIQPICIPTETENSNSFEMTNSDNISSFRVPYDTDAWQNQVQGPRLTDLSAQGPSARSTFPSIPTSPTYAGLDTLAANSGTAGSNIFESMLGTDIIADDSETNNGPNFSGPTS